ncbi:protein translocase subunit SecD [Candidatus Kaiserbacteria bacterium CG10_big_fil_rev_8_21_14_0_10_59_10]|uniref:Protein translocase subunit SecD n=1 Tax=Candidatus Kaiserbacteria bacterium CG10_big_fil_rev_8_21_14_0_10_59_10 TaxID=1974612 RepID=A0A2H0U8P4_9BACT|nr:MAG: protein translocase subunit SecD [Candidatus Kaiserbacteria bacterium CG10_big_fil_rev_8_21_14_0_10_59_10]
MLKQRLAAILIFALGAALGWFVYASEVDGWRPFRLGLDLSGGTQLIYRADLSAIPTADVQESMRALREVIERRVNLFGVAEPLVQTERGGFFAGDVEERLIVELPGVTDTNEAIALIGQTPVLEFRMLREGAPHPAEGRPVEDVNEHFESATITGRHLERASLQFEQGVGTIPNMPIVVLNFNREGGDLFADLTRENVGRVFGIFLDGIVISAPVIREPIPGGSAVISGNFTAEGARELVRNLNYGALPLPIELISTQTIGSTLGEEAVARGVSASLWGIALVALFMLLWYRLPGAVAIGALALYILIMLALFKFVPVTLTAAGIAGFILSVGMAVDANVLIFERMREELRAGKMLREAIRDGFARAWLAIRDANISSFVTAIILFWFGTSLIEGFALVFGIGVLVSMLSAILVSRTLLLALSTESAGGVVRALFDSGLPEHRA